MAETTTSKYAIRYATEKDTPEILRMTQELAIYEKALDEVEATEEKFFNSLSFPTSTDEKIRNKPGVARALLIIPTQSSSSDVAQQVAGQLESETTTNAGPIQSTRTSNVAQEVSGQLETETSSNAGPQSDTGVAGMALYFNNYSTWLAKPGIYLEDLFVRPQYRKQGLGKALLQALARECVEKDYGRLDWSVLTWNTPSIDFYTSDAIGALPQDEWQGMRVTGDALIKLARSS